MSWLALSGALFAQDEAAAAPPPEPPADESPAAQTPAAPTPAAQVPAFSEAELAFEQALRAALLLETDVQNYERKTIGLEDPAELSGFRLERRLRVASDVAFNQRVREFSLQPLVLPTRAEITAASLNRQQLTLLSGLAKAYESSRTDTQLEELSKLNRRFLQTADWALRDRAVKLRETLIEREIVLTRLADQAHALVGGRADAGQLAEMETALYSVAPELQEEKPDLSLLVMRDPVLQAQVLGELQARLARPKPQPTTPPPAADLWPQVTTVHHELVETAQLAEVIAEHVAVDAQIETIDAQLEATAESADLETRMALVQQKVELILRRDELATTWYGVEPDPTLYPQLVAGQDQLIRRLMLDIGAGGALFAARRDRLATLTEGGLPTPRERWEFLQEQQDLLTELNAALPEPDLLESIEMLPMLPVPAAVAPAPNGGAPAAKATPKPQPKAGGGKSSAKPKPKLKPKPKPKPPPKPKPKAKPKGKAPGKPGSKPR